MPYGESYKPLSLKDVSLKQEIKQESSEAIHIGKDVA